METCIGNIEIKDNASIDERRSTVTNAIIRRIVQNKINALGLSDTVDEYLAKCEGSIG